MKGTCTTAATTERFVLITAYHLSQNRSTRQAPSLFWLGKLDIKIDELQLMLLADKREVLSASGACERSTLSMQLVGEAPQTPWIHHK